MNNHLLAGKALRYKRTRARAVQAAMAATGATQPAGMPFGMMWYLRGFQDSRRHRGFTLVEMLVVVAIIMVLVSLLFPAFESAQEKAQRVVCFNNQRQFGITCLQYAADNGGLLPLGHQSPYECNWPDCLNWFRGGTTTYLVQNYGLKYNYMLCASVATTYTTWSTRYGDYFTGMCYFGQRSTERVNPCEPYSFRTESTGVRYYFPQRLADRPTSYTLVMCPIWGSYTYSGWAAAHIRGKYVGQAARFGAGGQPPTGEVVMRMNGSAVWAPWSKLVAMLRGYDNLYYWYLPD